MHLSLICACSGWFFFGIFLLALAFFSHAFHFFFGFFLVCVFWGAQVRSVAWLLESWSMVGEKSVAPPSKHSPSPAFGWLLQPGSPWALATPRREESWGGCPWGGRLPQTNFVLPFYDNPSLTQQQGKRKGKKMGRTVIRTGERGCMGDELGRHRVGSNLACPKREPAELKHCVSPLAPIAHLLQNRGCEKWGHSILCLPESVETRRPRTRFKPSFFFVRVLCNCSQF